ncbi:hypothetical protein BJ138DRAFT_1021260, partial [Hygrophoropsis aurantiaca]
STRNSRIERLWVEVGSQFAQRWRAFFTRLERLHGLEVDTPGDLWLLATLFLDAINEDCEDFRHAWNAHPIRGPETNNKSPQVPFIAPVVSILVCSLTVNGVYVEECEGVHPDTLNRYYGVDLDGDEIIHQHRTGAGHPPDEDETDSDRASAPRHADLAARIEEDQQSQILHDAIDVPTHGNPFQHSDDGLEEAFDQVLAQAIAEDIVPYGYNLLEDETDFDPSWTEALQVGWKRGKVLQISLEDPVWRCRAKL